MLVFVLAGALVAAAPATALAAPTSGGKPTVAPGGETTLTGTSGGAGQSSGALPSSVPSLICLTCEPDPGPGVPSGCYSISISKRIERGDNPEFGGVYSRISWTGRVTCQLTSGGVPGVPITVSGRTLLVDRDPGYDGGILAFGQSFYGGGGSYTSTGQTDLFDIDYPIGANAELVLKYHVVAPSNRPWTSCNPIPGLRYIRCDGLDTNVLDIAMGTNSFSTGVTNPCSDPNRTKVDDERTVFGYGSLIDDVRIEFQPFIRWCWSGPSVYSISKDSNTYAWCDYDHPTWCDHEHFNIRPTTTDPTPFLVNGIGQYVVSFTIDVDPPLLSNLRKQTCVYVVDRIYRANGSKEIHDKLISCQPR